MSLLIESIWWFCQAASDARGADAFSSAGAEGARARLQGSQSQRAERRAAVQPELEREGRTGNDPAAARTRRRFSPGTRRKKQQSLDAEWDTLKFACFCPLRIVNLSWPCCCSMTKEIWSICLWWAAAWLSWTEPTFSSEFLRLQKRWLLWSSLMSLSVCDVWVSNGHLLFFLFIKLKFLQSWDLFWKRRKD